MKKYKPSATAMFVANGMYYNIHRDHLRDEIDATVKEYGSRLIEHVYRIRGPVSAFWHRFNSMVSQKFTVPGFFLHFLLRKKCIEKHVRKRIDAGFRQVIILGAGYDTLCSRLADVYPDVRFIELDHPATSADKISIFRELQWSRKNIEYIAHDLRDAEALFKEDRLNCLSDTVLVCEGVLMYLNITEVGSILNSISSRFTGRCEFIFTYMEESAPGKYMFRNATAFVRLFLMWKNERFTWGSGRQALEALLKQNGWSLQDIYDHQKLKTCFLTPLNRNLLVAMGENVAVCVKSR